TEAKYRRARSGIAGSFSLWGSQTFSQEKAQNTSAFYLASPPPRGCPVGAWGHVPPRVRNGRRRVLYRPRPSPPVWPVPQRQRYLFVCNNRRPDDNPKGSCAQKGSEEVHQALKAELAKRGLAKLGARACTASCLDQCASGVTVLVEPDHFFYGHVTLA